MYFEIAFLYTPIIILHYIFYFILIYSYRIEYTLAHTIYTNYIHDTYFTKFNMIIINVIITLQCVHMTIIFNIL